MTDFDFADGGNLAPRDAYLFSGEFQRMGSGARFP